MHTLVISTTGQPEANLESTRYFIENHSHIDKITILSTEYMRQQGKTDLLKQSLHHIHNMMIEVLDIPNKYEESNMLAIRELILNWINTHEPQDTFIFNITGGTKLISIALDSISTLLNKRVECFYQSRDHKIIWYQRQNAQTTYPINSNLDLQQRVLSRGYQITKQQPIQDIELIDLQYANILINIMHNDFHKGRQCISFMNKLATEAERHPDFSVYSPDIQAEMIETINFLADQTHNHFFRFNSSYSTITFQNKESINLVKGGWLEVYAGYEFFKVLIQLNPKAEVAINVELKKNDTPNEMDVMFIDHAQLYCIECKTAKTMTEAKAQDVLYKLSALQDFGGLNQKRAIISLYPLKHYNLTRAANAGIKIFQEKELLNLSEHILNWITSTNKKLE